VAGEGVDERRKMKILQSTGLFMILFSIWIWGMRDPEKELIAQIISIILFLVGTAIFICNAIDK
jgi:hypothetical protein